MNKGDATAQKSLQGCPFTPGHPHLHYNSSRKPLTTVLWYHRIHVKSYSVDECVLFQPGVTGLWISPEEPESSGFLTLTKILSFFSLLKKPFCYLMKSLASRLAWKVSFPLHGEFSAERDAVPSSAVSASSLPSGRYCPLWMTEPQKRMARRLGLVPEACWKSSRWASVRCSLERGGWRSPVVLLRTPGCHLKPLFVCGEGADKRGKQTE